MDYSESNFVNYLLVISLVALITVSCQKEVTDINPLDDLYISTKQIELNNHKISGSFQIQNNVGFECSIAFDYDTSLISMSNDYLILDPYNKSTVSVQVKLNNLMYDSMQTIIYVNFADIRFDSITINITDYSHGAAYFSNEIIEADYSKVVDKIAMISTDPENALITYDVNANEWGRILLNQKPLCISVSPAHATAAIGLDKKIVLIDLNSLEILNEFSIDDMPFDIILTSNNWIYVFPHNRLYYSINVAAGTIQITDDFWNMSAMRVRLEPNEKYIYGVWESVYSSEVTYKYDISNGVLSVIGHNSHDYNLHHDFWISKDGEIFGQSGKVFTSEAENQLQLLQIGILEGTHGVLWLEHNPLNNEIYLIDRYVRTWDEITSLYCYDATTFSMKKKIKVNKFNTTDDEGTIQLSDPWLKYVFFNSHFNECYVIAKALDGSGVMNDWFIQKIAI